MMAYWSSPFSSGLASVLFLVTTLLTIIVLFLAAAALLKYIQKK